MMSGDMNARVDWLLLTLEARNLGYERIGQAAARVTEAMRNLLTEFEVLDLRESIEFAELEDRFWASYNTTETRTTRM